MVSASCSSSAATPETRVVMDTSIAFRMEPCDVDRRPVRMLPEAIGHFVVCPPFIDDYGICRRIRRRYRVPSAEVLLLRLPEGLLAVARPEARDARGLAAQSATLPSGPSPSNLRRASGWCCRWRGASANGFRRLSKTGDAIPLDIAGMSRSVRPFSTRSFIGSVRLGLSRGTRPRPTTRMSGPGRRSRHYNASVVLRLRPDGSVARDDETMATPSNSLLTIVIGCGRHAAIAHRRRAAGFPCIRAHSTTRCSWRLIATMAHRRPRPGSVFVAGRFRSSAHVPAERAAHSAGAADARRRRRVGADRSTRSRDRRTRRALVLSSGFEIGEGNEVRWVPDSIRIVHSSLPFGTPPLPQPDLVRYCLRLLAALRDWVGVLR